MTRSAVDNVILSTTPVKGWTVVPTEFFKNWARDNGMRFSEHQGRIPQETIDAFHSDKANRRAKRQYIPGQAPQPPVTYTYNYTDGRGRERQGTFSVAPNVLRAWLVEQGLTKADRGRFSQAHRDAYGQAHRAAPRARKPKAEAPSEG